jgi:predicted solute-binding protein
MTEPLRFGYTGSAHLVPLLHPLVSGWVVPPGRAVTWHDLAPRALLAELDAGTLDAALVAPVAYARRRARLALLPGVGLASEGPTAAAVLHSSQRADSLDGQVIHVPAPPTDEAGAALLAVLLRPHFGIAALTLGPDAPVPEGRTVAGSLLTGDAALAVRRPGLLYVAYLRSLPDPGAPAPRRRPTPGSAPEPATTGYTEDLGAAWWVLTGVPIVWAVGVVRQEIATPETLAALGAGFDAARRAATEQQPTILQAAAGRVQLPEPVLAALLAPQTTTLGPRELGALEAYFTYTRRLGLTR